MVPTSSLIELIISSLSGHTILASTSDESDEGGAAQPPPKKKLRSSTCQALPSANMQQQQATAVGPFFVSYNLKDSFFNTCIGSRLRMAVLLRMPTMAIKTTMAHLPSRSTV